MFDTLSGERFRSERKRLGKKQADMAALCGVRREMWGKYERDEVVPNGEVLRLFALAGGDVQYVLTGQRLDVASTPDERSLIALYRAASPVLRTAAISVLAGAGAGGQTTHGGGIAIGGNASNVGNVNTYNAPVDSVHIGPQIIRKDRG